MNETAAFWNRKFKEAEMDYVVCASQLITSDMAEMMIEAIIRLAVKRIKEGAAAVSEEPRCPTNP